MNRDISRTADAEAIRSPQNRGKQIASQRFARVRCNAAPETKGKSMQGQQNSAVAVLLANVPPDVFTAKSRLAIHSLQQGTKMPDHAMTPGSPRRSSQRQASADDALSGFLYAERPNGADRSCAMLEPHPRNALATGSVMSNVAKTTGMRRLSMAASAVALLALGLATSIDARAEDNRDTLYVGDQGDNTVKTFDAVTGFPKGTLIPPAGQMSPFSGPRGMIFSDGDLLVVNQNVNLTDGPGIPGEILRFDDKTGKLLQKIVPALLKNGSNNPAAPGAPRGMVVWNGKIIVADITDDPNNLVQGSVREYSESGRPILPLMKAPKDQIDPASFHPRGVVVGPDGLLYVSNAPNLAGPNGHVVRFDPGDRKFIDKFVDNSDGTAKDCTKNLNRPEGLVFGPDGRLYITTFRANGADPVTQDTDAILVFEGPDGAYPGACVDHIDLDSPGAVGGDRAFAQALLFGPQGRLFVPISGNGDAGAIRRYDVHNHAFTDFVSAAKSPLESPDFVTFGKTDPETLSYPDE